jgi:hypothetical protein
MAYIMQMLSVPASSADVQRCIDASGRALAADSGCAVYVDPMDPQTSILGGLTPFAMIRILGASAQVGLIDVC